MCWKDKRQIYLLTNMNLPASGHFVDKEGKASKSVCIKSYAKSMGFVDLSDMMATSHSISYRTWNGLKILFILLPGLTILNTIIILYKTWGVTHT